MYPDFTGSREANKGLKPKLHSKSRLKSLFIRTLHTLGGRGAREKITKRDPLCSHKIEIQEHP